jgi:hypothetical protein
VAQTAFFWPKMRKLKIKKEIFCRNIPFLWEKKGPNFEGKKLKKNSPHLDCAFSLVSVFTLVLFFMFRQVRKACRHLMLNPFSDASQ